MNLYIESSKVLHDVMDKRGAIKTLVYKSEYENKKQLYGLVCETLKYNNVLQQIVTNTELLTKEHLLKKDCMLAQSLLHDFVFRNKLSNCGRLGQTMKRHKQLIYDACDKLMEEADVSDLKELIDPTQDKIPRYVRVNLLKTTTRKVIDKFMEDGWTYTEYSMLGNGSYAEVIGQLEQYQFTNDSFLPDLLVFPAHTDLHDNLLLISGEIILQDKASCFPAHILSPPEGATIMDCCAAPGNKTTHLASLIGNNGTIYAFDKDGRRLATMQKLVLQRGASCIQMQCRDFLRVDPTAYDDVEYILVDPSCSGSGIVDRMNEVTDDKVSSSADRLKSLSNFQSVLLKHALKFPNVKRVVYSTCSIHAEENEDVVNEVLRQVSDSFEIKAVMPEWPYRGKKGYENESCFLRMSPDTALTNGFFVACLERIAGDSNTCEEINPEKKKKHKRKHEDICESTENEQNCDEGVKIKKVKKHKHKPENVDESDENESSIDEGVQIVKVKKHKTKHKDVDKSVEYENSVDEGEKRRKHKKHKHRDIDDSAENESSVVEGEKRKKHKKHKHGDIDDSAENESSVVAGEKRKKHKKYKRKDIDDSAENESSVAEGEKRKKHKHKDIDDSAESESVKSVHEEEKRKKEKKHKRKHKDVEEIIENENNVDEGEKRKKDKKHKR